MTDTETDAPTPERGLIGRVLDWFRRPPRSDLTLPRERRGPHVHVVILDGTMSSLEPGYETNAGLARRLLRELPAGAGVSMFYEPGIQFTSWRQLRDVVEGRGLNRQIRRAYGWLASRYRPGDRIFLLGYSRGAYGVRSLAGVIDRIGLLRHDAATERNVELAYRYYRNRPCSSGAAAFHRRFCHARTTIDMIGCWDTVKALGLRLPVIWRWFEPAHEFHSHALGASTRAGYHALALDETRRAYAPVMWTTGDGWQGRCEQVWFRGAHGDVGGNVGDHAASRPLSNIPLVWLMGRAEDEGLPLPEGWRQSFPCDAAAPASGMNRGWGRLFLGRERRLVGADPSERIHSSVGGAAPGAEAVSHRAKADQTGTV